MSPLDRAIEAVGGASLLARMVGVTQSAPSMWRARGAVPIERCVAIERATDGKVMRWDLRPDDWRDIWPELAERPDAPVLTPNPKEQIHE